MSAHTPGPWTAKGPDNCGWAYVRSAGAAFDGDLATVWSPPGRASAAANALLMASAPELLAALRTFATLPADTPPPGILPSAWRAALEAAQAAIAKAEGR